VQSNEERMLLGDGWRQWSHPFCHRTCRSEASPPAAKRRTGWRDESFRRRVSDRLRDQRPEKYPNSRKPRRFSGKCLVCGHGRRRFRRAKWRGSRRWIGCRQPWGARPRPWRSWILGSSPERGTPESWLWGPWWWNEFGVFGAVWDWGVCGCEEA